MRFMRATGNLVLISMFVGLGFLYCGLGCGCECDCWDCRLGPGKEGVDWGSLFMRGPRAEDMSGCGW
jgi:hypothetical protein